MLKQLAFYRWN